MDNTGRRFGRLLLGLAVLATSATFATHARADYGYGFASQTISGLSVIPTSGTFTGVSPVTSTTTASATLNGSGPATADPLDAPQAYLGGSPAAPENDFARYAPGITPISPVGNFTRGDALIASLIGPTNSASVVAESFIDNGPSIATGASGLTASVTLTPTVNTTLTIAYHYANDIYVTSAGDGSSTATYKFDVTIKDALGNIVFDSSSATTNVSLAAPPPGVELIRTGTESFTTGTLTGGNAYTLIFSSSALTSARAVPEPGSLALLGMGFAGAYGLFRRRKAKLAA